MKKLILILAFLGTATIAQAGTPTSKNFYDKKYHNAGVQTLNQTAVNELLTVSDFIINYFRGSEHADNRISIDALIKVRQGSAISGALKNTIYKLKFHRRAEGYSWSCSVKISTPMGSDDLSKVKALTNSLVCNR